LIDKATPQDSGAFLAYDGALLPWWSAAWSGQSNLGK
jgi:hypothetical protein